MSRRPNPEAVDLVLVLVAIFVGMLGAIYAIQNGGAP
jgi:hypothetical protein